MNKSQLAPAREHFIESSTSPGGRLFVRSRLPREGARGALLAVHGATIASSLFDVPFDDYSLLAAAADAGFAAYALDMRGYGRSIYPALDESVAATRAEQTTQDVLDVLRYIAATEGVPRVHLLGGSWGSIVASKFCGAHADLVDRFVLMAPIYAERNPGWLNDLADPENPQLPRAFGASRWVVRTDLTRRWDPEIPYEDFNRRRDDRVLDWLLADLARAEAHDLAGEQRFRAPNGTLLDLFEAFSGRAGFDPARLSRPTLLIRGEHDGTSTASDAARLFSALATPDKTLVTIGDSGHFLCVERRRREFQAHVLAFLSASDGT
jgi:pimeloyl-ACP methyl ester carboxylesterase